jgi:hypothetical protein
MASGRQEAAPAPTAVDLTLNPRSTHRQRELGPLLEALFVSAHGFVFLAETGTRIFHGPECTDLRWSHDGRSLMVCAGEGVMFTRTDEPSATLMTDNAAGTLRFRGPRDWKGLSKRSRGPALVSADFDRYGRVLSAWSDGRLRRGFGADSPELAEIPRARRLRASPSLDAVAVLAHGQEGASSPQMLFLVEPSKDPPRRLLGHVPPRGGGAKKTLQASFLRAKA